MGEKSKNTITVYQKPTCTKCRATLRILNERGVDYEAINYFEAGFNPALLRELIQKLGVSPRDILRKDEQIYRDLGLAKTNISDEELIEVMCNHPDLIQRPIVVKGTKAVLGRPPEKIEELL